MNAVDSIIKWSLYSESGENQSAKVSPFDVSEQSL